MTTPKKLKKKHRLCGYFDQLEVFELKLFLKKETDFTSMSDFIRSALFFYKSKERITMQNVMMQLDDLKRVMSIAKLPGGSLSQEQKVWENYEKKKQEVFEKDTTKVSNEEFNRREVIRELKDTFKKGKNMLSKVPKEELQERQERLQERRSQNQEKIKNK
jgi:hypothetical protein